MFLVFGYKPFKKVVGERQNWCYVCRNTKTVYVRTANWFTLFFIPLFPILFSYSKICTGCGHEETLTKKQFRKELARPDELPPSPFSDDVFEGAEKEREITVIRQKKAYGGFIKIAIFYGNRELGRLKNGQSAKFTVENTETALYAKYINLDSTFVSNAILLKPTDTNNTFYVSFVKRKLVISDNEQLSIQSDN